MSGTDLQTRSGNQPMMQRPDDGSPATSLRRQMNRLFDEFLSAPMFPFPAMPPMPMPATMIVSPRVEVSETEKELHVTAELPGIDPKDIEVTLVDDVLTLKGEKQSNQDDEERDYHLTERTYGTFTRYLRLPFRADPGNVQASFKDGVLTLTIPKPPEAQQKVHRIAVNAEGAADTASAPAEQRQAAE